MFSVIMKKKAERRGATSLHLELVSCNSQLVQCHGCTTVAPYDHYHHAMYSLIQPSEDPCTTLDIIFRPQIAASSSNHYHLNLSIYAPVIYRQLESLHSKDCCKVVSRRSRVIFPSQYIYSPFNNYSHCNKEYRVLIWLTNQWYTRCHIKNPFFK